MPRYIKIPPELGDGQSSFVLDDVHVVLDAVRLWAEMSLKGWFEDGDSVKLEVVEMSKKEYESLSEEQKKPTHVKGFPIRVPGCDVRSLFNR